MASPSANPNTQQTQGQEKYQVVRFTPFRNFFGFVPSHWIRTENFQFKTKYIKFPCGRESYDEFNNLLKECGNPMDTWPEYKILVCCGATSYSDAYTKLGLIRENYYLRRQKYMAKKKTTNSMMMQFGGKRKLEDEDLSQQIRRIQPPNQAIVEMLDNVSLTDQKDN